MIIQRQTPALKFGPIQIFIVFTMYFHGNTFFNRTYQVTEITSNTVIILNDIIIIGVSVNFCDCLM